MSECWCKDNSLHQVSEWAGFDVIVFQTSRCGRAVALTTKLKSVKRKWQQFWNRSFQSRGYFQFCKLMALIICRHTHRRGNDASDWSLDSSRYVECMGYWLEFCAFCLVWICRRPRANWSRAAPCRSCVLQLCVAASGLCRNWLVLTLPLVTSSLRSAGKRSHRALSLCFHSCQCFVNVLFYHFTHSLCLSVCV